MKILIYLIIGIGLLGLHLALRCPHTPREAYFHEDCAQELLEQGKGCLAQRMMMDKAYLNCTQEVRTCGRNLDECWKITERGE